VKTKKQLLQDIDRYILVNTVDAKLLNLLGSIAKHLESSKDVNFKLCEVCGGKLISLPSMNIRQCSECLKEFDFSLKPKQKSVLNKGLVG